MIRDEGLGALRKGMGPTFDEFSRCCPCPFKLPKPAPLLILPAFPSFLRLFLPLSSLLHFSYPRFTFFYNVEEIRGEGGGGAPRRQSGAATKVWEKDLKEDLPPLAARALRWREVADAPKMQHYLMKVPCRRPRRHGYLDILLSGARTPAAVPWNSALWLDAERPSQWRTPIKIYWLVYSRVSPESLDSPKSGQSGAGLVYRVRKTDR